MLVLYCLAGLNLRVVKIFLQVSQGMVGQIKARRAAGIIVEMIKVMHTNLS